MDPGETISSMHMCFVHIVNKLQKLGKTLFNQDCAKKSVKIYVQRM